VAETNPDITTEEIQQRIQRSFPADMGVEPLELTDELCRGRIVVDDRHLHPGRLVHGGAWVALADAIKKLPANVPKPRGNAPAVLPARFDPQFYDPAHAMADQIAAVSVGIIEGKAYLDLDYNLDSRAEVDMNVAYTAAGKFVEIQGSAENGQGFERQTMDTLLDLAVGGCERIMDVQRESLE